jgi:hypothetical protein
MGVGYWVLGTISFFDFANYSNFVHEKDSLSYWRHKRIR